MPYHIVADDVTELEKKLTSSWRQQVLKYMIWKRIIRNNSNLLNKM